MNYNRILAEIARKEHTTAQEVDKQIRAALKAAGFEGMAPELFICMCVMKLKKDNIS